MRPEPVFTRLPYRKGMLSLESKYLALELKFADLLTELALTQSKVANLGEQVAHMKSELRKNTGSAALHHLPAVDASGNIRVQLADSLNTIAGLKEAIKTKHPCLRNIWVALLCLGIGATIYFIFDTAVEYLDEPTATNVKLVGSPTYDYPPMLLCPDGWIDVDKTDAVGLSNDALKYSLGFYDSLKNFQLANRTAARKEFLKFFYAHDLPSLRSYYKNIAVDLEVAHSLGDLANSTVPSYWCEECNKTSSGTKIFMNSGVCYAFFLTPSEGIEIWSNRRKIIIKVPDHPNNLFNISTTWQVFFTPNLNLLFSPVPAITLESSYRHILKLTAQKFVTLDKDDAHCVTPKEVARTNYSAEACVGECKNRVYKGSIGCQIFLMSSGIVQQPTEFCNYFDPLPGKNQTVLDLFASDGRDALKSAAGQSCSRNCHQVCEKFLYEAVLDVQTPLGDFDARGATENMGSSNTSVKMLSVEVVHSAAYQGGILTLVEMNTYSFTAFVNNVGGTLGLFVGGTLMTLVQVVMFFVTWMLDKRRPD